MKEYIDKLLEFLSESLYANATELYKILIPISLLIMAAGLMYTAIVARDDVFTVMKKFAGVILVGIALSRFYDFSTEAQITFLNLSKDFGVEKYDVAATLNETVSAMSEKNKEEGGGVKKVIGILFGSESSHGFGMMLMASVVGVMAQLAAFIRAVVIVFQSVILTLGSVLAPIFIPMLLVGALRNIGFNYIMGMVGILLWPLGWAVADIVSNALIETAVTKEAIKVTGFGDSTDVDIVNASIAIRLMLILGPWVIFSSLAAPLIMQKVASTGASIGSAMMGGFGMAMAAAGGAAAVAARGSSGSSTSRGSGSSTTSSSESKSNSSGNSQSQASGKNAGNSATSGGGAARGEGGSPSITRAAAAGAHGFIGSSMKAGEAGGNYGSAVGQNYRGGSGGGGGDPISNALEDSMNGNSSDRSDSNSNGNGNSSNGNNGPQGKSSGKTQSGKPNSGKPQAVSQKTSPPKGSSTVQRGKSKADLIYANAKSKSNRIVPKMGARHHKTR